MANWFEEFYNTMGDGHGFMHGRRHSKRSEEYQEYLRRTFPNGHSPDERYNQQVNPQWDKTAVKPPVNPIKVEKLQWKDTSTCKAAVNYSHTVSGDMSSFHIIGYYGEEAFIPFHVYEQQIRPSIPGDKIKQIAAIADRDPQEATRLWAIIILHWAAANCLILTPMEELVI